MQSNLGKLPIQVKREGADSEDEVDFDPPPVDDENCVARQAASVVRKSPNSLMNLNETSSCNFKSHM